MVTLSITTSPNASGASPRETLDCVYAPALKSDVGMGLTSLILTDLLQVEPTRFAVINLAGLGGMMVGTLTAGFAQEEPLMAGNVIGSLAGLTLGAIVTSFFDRSEQVSPYEEAAD